MKISVRRVIWKVIEVIGLCLILGTMLSFAFLLVDIILPQMAGHVILQLDGYGHMEWVSSIWLRFIGYEIAFPFGLFWSWSLHIDPRKEVS